MAAQADFSYLHSIARDPETHYALDLIEADRNRILQGDPVEESHDLLTLRLTVGTTERAVGTVEPPANAEESGAGTNLFTLTLRRDLAPASVDTIIEIFREEKHARVRGFGGSTPPTQPTGVGEPVRTIVDLGANEGFYTLRMRRLFPESRIVAVEPIAENCDLLRLNLRNNGIRGVEVRQVAVTGPREVRTPAVAPEPRGNDLRAEEKLVTMQTYPHVGTIAAVDMAHLKRPWIAPELLRRHRVPGISFGELLGELEITDGALLKIDIEGSETAILSEDPRLLRRFTGVVVEVHGGRSRRGVVEVLTGAGFALVYEETTATGDLYWRRIDSRPDR